MGKDSDEKKGEAVVDSSRHERKEKRKRKRDMSGVAGDVSEDVKGDVNAESKRERRKKRELELDNDRDVETEKPRKDGKRRRGDNGDIRSESEGVSGEKKKKKKKKHEDKLGDDKSAVMEGEEIVENGKKKDESSEQCRDEGSTDQPDLGKKDKKKKKKHKDKLGDDKSAVMEGEEIVENGKKKDESSEQCRDEGSTDQPDLRKKDKKKNKKHEDKLGDDKSAVREGEEIMEKGKKKKEDSKQGQGEGSADQPDSETRDKSKEDNKNEKKKKGKGKEDKTEKERKVKKDKLTKGSSRKVRFADDVEVFPSSDNPSEEDGKEKHKLVHGKRFTPEEDELLKKAVYSYIEDHGLGEDGLAMVLQSSKHAETRGKCWKDITAALPWRPPASVQYRAHVLFERSETRSWTEEECELIKSFHAKHGSDWRTLADALQKHRIHVKDTWRRINPTNLKKGHWTQDEYQGLFDLVNKDLQMRAIEEKVSDNRVRRDNICWEAISKKLTTRSNSTCCVKWYEQLSSPMVAEGIWTDTDDYRLLNALVSLDACSMEEVEWDYLVEDRPGDVCRKRWSQMVRHIGEHGKKSFVEQVEILSERYCPDLVEVREAVDKKRLED